MKKFYLLIAGQGYYPSSGTGDWIGCYETLKELRKVIDDANGTEHISKWNISMTRTDAAIEYYEDYVNE